MTLRDLQFVAHLCAEKAGLRVDPEKVYLVENRLSPVARREGFGSLHELLTAVRDRDDDRLGWSVVEAMSPAESAFFRDPGAFDLIAEALPNLARRRQGEPLRIWAAQCGAGQEVYSLAMLLDERAPAGTAIELYGSDLCERRLEKAQSGFYSQFEVQRGLAARRLVRHFEAQDDGFVLSPRLRQTVRWRRVNLLDDLARFGRFDLILCRSLLGALLDTARGRVLENLAKVLVPGGLLVLGASETAPGLVASPERPGFLVAGPGARAAA